MSQYVEWVEPYGDGAEAVIMQMSCEDVAKWQRRREPRYTSDQEAIDDFVVVHWGKIIEREAA